MDEPHECARTKFSVGQDPASSFKTSRFSHDEQELITFAPPPSLFSPPAHESDPFEFSVQEDTPKILRPLIESHSNLVCFQFHQEKLDLLGFLTPPPLEHLLVPGLESIQGYLSGTASWYGDDFHGKSTASGETYDQHSLTCAHPVLPMNTLVEVENTVNGRTVVLRVNDRGPYADDKDGKPRIIDISRTGATALRMIGAGISKVNLRVIQWPSTLDRDAGLTAYNQFVVQLGSFETTTAAKRRLQDIQARCPWADVTIDRAPQSAWFAIVSRPDSSREACSTLSERFREDGFGCLVRRFRK